jgi:hypothetical protein
MSTELFNLLINPDTDAFSLVWHRDDVKPQAEADEERERLAITSYGVSSLFALVETLVDRCCGIKVQWNT